jgi:hypothetical protein
MILQLTTGHENAKHLVGAPLVGALGGHKGRPYGIFTSVAHARRVTSTLKR